MNKKIIALVLVFILIINIVLFSMKLISNLIFWTIIIAIGLISYFWFKKRK